MRPKSSKPKASAERVVKDIRRASISANCYDDRHLAIYSPNFTQTANIILSPI